MARTRKTGMRGEFKARLINGQTDRRLADHRAQRLSSVYGRRAFHKVYEPKYSARAFALDGGLYEFC